jgi:hypothetical protein
MTEKTALNATLCAGLFLPSGRYLGPALLLRSSAAILGPHAAQSVLGTGIEGLPRHYWITAGPEQALFGAPATALRIAEEPDPDGVHHVAVALDLAAWSDGAGAPVRGAAFTGQPCTKADATVVGKQVAAVPAPDAGWLEAAASAVADLVQRYETPAAPRMLPAWLPQDPPASGPEPLLWPFNTDIHFPVIKS